MDESSDEDVEEKYQRASLANTLLENECQVYSFEADGLREEFDALEDDYLQVRRSLRDKTRTCDLLQRDSAKLKDSCVFMEHCIDKKDELFERNGVSYLRLRPFRSICDNRSEPVDRCESDEGDDDNVDPRPESPKFADVVLVSDPSDPVEQIVINFLDQFERSTLEEKLRELISEKVSLQKTAERLRKEVKDKRQANLALEERVFTDSYRLMKPTDDPEALETEREKIHVLKEYRDQLKNSSGEITRLKDKLTNLETELDQLRSRCTHAEHSEVSLTAKKRQSLRQLREVEAKIGELEGLNNLLFKKLERIKQAKYAVS